MEMQTTVFIRRVFKCKSLPLLAIIYKIGFASYDSILKKGLIALPFRMLHSLLYRLGFAGTGKFIYSNQGKDTTLSFNARNTQFHSIFLPEYEMGYEVETIALLDHIITKDDIFYDIGSNWGHFSLHIASNEKFKGQIFAFEPMPTTFKDLQDIVRQSKLEDRIECHNIALYSSNQNAFISAHGVHSGSAKLNNNGIGSATKLQRLDDLDLPLPSIMKVDAEDSEGEIFSGGKEMLNMKKPFIVFENWLDLKNPETTLLPLAILKELGYKFYLPVFHQECNRSYYYIKQGEYISSDLPEKMDIALMRFHMEERFILGTQINIFACHESKMPALRLAFNTPKFD